MIRFGEELTKPAEPSDADLVRNLADLMEARDRLPEFSREWCDADAFVIEARTALSARRHARDMAANPGVSSD